MGNHSVTYTDSRGSQLDIEVDEDASAWVGLRLSENREPLGIVIPADKRETLARALAGWHHGVQPAQPDRPEPVDPSEVRVGDVVDYERKPGYETCRIVGKVDETFNFGHGISLRIHSLWWNTAPGMATVRILHRAEPEPDPAAVEALAEILDSDPLSVAGTTDDVHKMARRMVRRGVRVEVPDA